ncbi:Ig-like domain-containing protein [Nanoarchaeota archaeon]
MKKLLLIGIMLMLVLPIAFASTVTRDFSNPSVETGGELDVTLNIDIDDGATFYIIDEIYPDSWTVIDPSTGDTSDSGHIKWVVPMGAVSTSYTYKLQAPDLSGSHIFNGEYIFEGMADVDNISGDILIDVDEPVIPLEIENIVLSEITNSSMRLQWDTNKLSNSTVNYGITQSLGLSESVDESVTNHDITISNLEAGTLYYYTLESCDDTECVNSSVFSFSTQSNLNQIDDLNVNYIRGQVFIDGVEAPAGTNFTIGVISGENQGNQYDGEIDDSKIPSFLLGNGYFDTQDQVIFSTGSRFVIEIEGCDEVTQGTFLNGGNGDFVTQENLVIIFCNNAPPVINTLSDYEILEGEVPSNPVLDLWQETSDEEDLDSLLSFEIINQTNTDLVGCTIDSNQYVNCTLTGTLPFGESTITFQVTDTGNLTDTEELNFIVTHVNFPPEINLPDQEIVEEGSLDINLTDYSNDSNDDALTYEITSENQEEVDCDINDETLTITGALNFYGTASCSVIANDGDLNSTEDTFSINVTPVNDPPEFNESNPIPDQAWDEDNFITLDLSQYFTDPENDALTYNVSQTTTWIDFNFNDSVVTIVSAVNWNGVEYVTFSASDGSETVESNNVTLTVNPVNDAPEINSTPTLIATEDTLYTYDVIATDVDLDTLEYSLTTAPTGMTIDNETGLVTWTPLNEHVGLNDVSILVSDGILNATQEYSINVSNTNDAPEFNESNPIPDQTWEEDTNTSIDLSAYFTDPDGDALTYTANGTTNVDVIIDGSLATLVSPSDWNGVEVVSFSASDGSESVDSNNVTLTVTPVNDAPTITSTPITSATEDTPYVYDVDATDVDLDTLEYTLLTNPSGMAINNITGEITWTPLNEHVGLNVVNVEVSDGNLTDTQAFSIEVENVNDAPEFNESDPIPDQTWAEDSEASIDLSNYFIDPDGNDLNYSAGNTTVNIIIDIDGSVATLIPANEWNGVEYVTFTATDPSNESADSNNVTLTVTPVNDAPVITSTPITEAIEDTPYTYDVEASDLENDTLEYTLLTNPTGMAINNETGEITWTPLNEHVGLNDVSVQVSDGSLTDVQNFAIDVNNTNDAPEYNESNPILDKTWAEDTLAYIDLNGHFTDIDGDTLTYTSLGNSNIAITFENGIATLTPTQDWNGAEVVIFTATDPSNESIDSNNVTLTVTPVNDAPVLDAIADITVVENETVYIVDPTATDVDGDDLTFSFTSPLDENGTWTPDFNESGIYTVTVTVDDGNGGTDSQEVTITVGEYGNHDPVIDPISDITITEGELVEVTPTALDIDHDPLTFSFSEPLDENGQWQTNYTHSGTYEIAVTVNDDHNGSDDTNFTLTVLESGNHAPILEPVSDVTVTEGELVEVVVNAYDPDGDEITITYSNPLDENGQWQTTFIDANVYVATVEVTDGLLTVSDDVIITVLEAGNQNPVLDHIPDVTVTEGELVDIDPTASDPEGDSISFLFTQPLNDNGEWYTSFTDAGVYTVSVTALDENGGTDSQFVTINVIEFGNHNPTLHQLVDITVTEGELVDINPIAMDIDGDPLTFSFSEPLNSEGEWQTSYTDQGTYNVTIAVTDGRGGYASQQITITVLDSGNHAPTLSGVHDIKVLAGDLVLIQPEVSDPDGDELLVTISEPVGDDGKWQTDRDDIGDYQVTVAVSDGEVIISKTITIQVIKKKLNRLHLSRIAFNDEYLRAGDPLDVFVSVSNFGSIKEKDLRVTVSIPDFGEWRKSRSFDLRSGESDTRRVTLDLPPWAEPGEYDVRIVVSNDKNRRVRIRPITVE